MINLLRISSSYEVFINDFKRKNSNINKFNYSDCIEKFFLENYSVSNNYSKAFSKIGFNCNEIIENFEFLQKLWLNEYGNKKSKNEVLFQQIDFYKPNVIFIGNPNILTENFYLFCKNRDFVKKILCFHCAPLNKKIIVNMSRADGILTCTEGYKVFFEKKLKKKVLKIYHAFSQNSKIKDSIIREIDISFIGSVFLGNKLHDDRIAMLHEVSKKFKNIYFSINFANFLIPKVICYFLKNIFTRPIKSMVIIYKYFYLFFRYRNKVYGNKMYEILNNTKILINIHIGDTEYAGNMRMFEGTGSGCMLLTDKKKDNDKLFSINKERKDIEDYESAEDLVNKLKFYLGNKNQLNLIAKNGRETTLELHNYDLRVREISNYLNNL